MHYALHNVNVNRKFASADVKAAKEFLETRNKLIVEENYLAEQIFSVDESSLIWKQIPEKTFIHLEDTSTPGFQAFKDGITVSLEGDVAGWKVKPFAPGTVRTPGPLSKAISTHGRCST